MFLLQAFWLSCTNPMSFRRLLMLPLRKAVVYFVSWYVLGSVFASLALGVYAYTVVPQILPQIPDQGAIIFDGPSKSIQAEAPVTLPLVLSHNDMQFRIEEKAFVTKMGNFAEQRVPFNSLESAQQERLPMADLKRYLPKLLVGTLSIAVLFGGLFLAVMRFLSICLYGWIMLFFLRLLNIRMPWHKALQMGLFAGVVAEVFAIVAGILYQSLNWPMYDIIFWVISAIGLYSLRPLRPEKPTA